MPERIYTSAEDGALEALEETPFSTEDELQALIAEHPELLDGEQTSPGDARRWILITREKGIAASSGAAARWAVDHLIIDQDAVPTLAELNAVRTQRYGAQSSDSFRSMRHTPQRRGRRMSCATRSSARPMRKAGMRETSLRHCFKRMESLMWMASGRMHPRTLRPSVCVCCLLRTTYPILSRGWWRSSTRRCRALRFWQSRSSGSTASPPRRSCHGSLAERQPLRLAAGSVNV